MWWVIHMCRGFDPLFSLWQDRARSFWGIFLIHQQQSYLLGYKNYQLLQKSIFLAPNSFFSSIFLGPIFSGQRHTPISFQAEYPPRGVMRHGLLLADITLLLLAGLDIGWDCLSHNGLDQWEFTLFFRGHWQSPCTAPNLPAIRAVQGGCERVYWPQETAGTSYSRCHEAQGKVGSNTKYEYINKKIYDIESMTTAIFQLANVYFNGGMCSNLYSVNIMELNVYSFQRWTLGDIPHDNYNAMEGWKVSQK